MDLLLLGSSSIPERGFEAECLRSLANPRFAPIGAFTGDRFPEFQEVGVREWFVDAIEPSAIARRRLATPKLWVASEPSGQARPLPVLGPCDEFRTQGVPLDVAKDRCEMIIILHRKSFISSLPDVP